MEVSCDPEKAYSEGCCELSSVVSHPSNITASLFLVIGVEYVWSHMVTYMSIAVWRICSDRPHRGKTLLQMYAWAAWHPGRSRTKGECHSACNWLKLTDKLNLSCHNFYSSAGS